MWCTTPWISLSLPKISPFGVCPLFYSHVCPIWGRWGQLWFCCIFPCFAFVLVDPQTADPFYTPKTLRLKGKLSNLDAKNTTKLGKKTPKGQTVPFSRMHAHFLRGTTGKTEIFRLKPPFAGTEGKGGFFGPETLFSWFCGFWSL